MESLETRSNGAGNILGNREATECDAPIFRFSWRFPGCCMFLKIHISVVAHFPFEALAPLLGSFVFCTMTVTVCFFRVFGLVRGCCCFSRFPSVLLHVSRDSQPFPPPRAFFFSAHDGESVIFSCIF
jgi:hypothetical protein